MVGRPPKEGLINSAIPHDSPSQILNDEELQKVVDNFRIGLKEDQSEERDNSVDVNRSGLGVCGAPGH
jgi:hypothetical protein